MGTTKKRVEKALREYHQFRRDKKKVDSIAADAGVSRFTIYRWLAQMGNTSMRTRGGQGGKKITSKYKTRFTDSESVVFRIFGR